MSADDIAAGSSYGWILSTTLRVTSDESPLYDGSPFVGYRDGVNLWQMNFGLDASGDTYVRLYTSVDTGPVHAMVGNSSFNTLALVYDPVAGSADLFVNGDEVISDYVGEANLQTKVLWGAARAPAAGQGNFNNVSFATVPEPSTISMWLIVVTGLCVFARQRRNQRRALQSH